MTTILLVGCGDDATPGSQAGTAVTPPSEATDVTPAPTSATLAVASIVPPAPLDDDETYHVNEPAAMEDLVGRWSDGVNTFAFRDDGVLTFTLDESCDGTYALGAHGDLDVSFGACGDSSVMLSAPIFRQATVYREGDSLYLDGDAGVFRLDVVSDP